MTVMIIQSYIFTDYRVSLSTGTCQHAEKLLLLWPCNAPLNGFIAGDMA